MSVTSFLIGFCIGVVLGRLYYGYWLWEPIPVKEASD